MWSALSVMEYRKKQQRGKYTGGMVCICYPAAQGETTAGIRRNVEDMIERLLLEQLEWEGEEEENG